MAAKKKYVEHHQPGRSKPNIFVLIKKNPTGTVDFGLEDGTVVVEGCPVGKQSDPAKSYAVITDKDDSAEELAEEAKKLRGLAAKAAKSARDAINVADAAKGKPDEAALREAADKASADAAQADAEATAAEKAAE